jgi:hypothetical protein
VDDETRDILETAVKTLQVLGGRVLLLQAQVHALEYGFLSSQEKRGVDRVEAEKALRALEKAYSESLLTEIGDKSPQTAEAMDFQGLLVKLIDRIQSDPGLGQP